MPQGIVIAVQPSNALHEVNNDELTPIDNQDPDNLTDVDSALNPKDIFIGYCLNSTNTCTCDNIDSIVVYRGTENFKKGDPVDFEDLELKKVKLEVAKKVKPR